MGFAHIGNVAPHGYRHGVPQPILRAECSRISLCRAWLAKPARSSIGYQREKCYVFTMHDKLNITVEAAEPEFIERAARYRANGEWLTEHGAPCFAQFPGKYIAVSEGEVFVADDALEARRLASQKHPGDEPFVQYIPRENRPRIYAC